MKLGVGQVITKDKNPELEVSILVAEKNLKMVHEDEASQFGLDTVDCNVSNRTILQTLQHYFASLEISINFGGNMRSLCA